MYVYVKLLVPLKSYSEYMPVYFDAYTIEAKGRAQEAVASNQSLTGLALQVTAALCNVFTV